jgi:hypothetical protein
MRVIGREVGVMLKSVTVKFPVQKLEQIKMVAEKRGETISDTIRYLVDRGMTERIMEENSDMIAAMIKIELEEALRNYKIVPCLDDVEHPDNTFNERLILYRAGKNNNLPS